jgi:hypothetical protein
MMPRMAKRLDTFPRDKEPRRYPWHEWTDRSAWEIRRGDDYDSGTENMRANLHMKAETLGIKVRTKKVRDERGEGLVFQFYDPDESEANHLLTSANDIDLGVAMDQLYADAMNIYEVARQEVMIPRSDGSQQKYAAVRYKQQIERARENDELVPAIARIIKKRTTGFDHLEAAGRHDLMLENLVLDPSKLYHRFFTKNTIETARKRMEPDPSSDQ